MEIKRFMRMKILLDRYRRTAGYNDCAGTRKLLKQEIGERKSLDLDLQDLEYISSAGLRVILSAQKVMNRQGNMVLRNVREEVMDVFEITGFVDILTIQ